jgi:hypothetical protein
MSLILAYLARLVVHERLLVSLLPSSVDLYSHHNTALPSDFGYQAQHLALL